MFLIFIYTYAVGILGLLSYCPITHLHSHLAYSHNSGVQIQILPMKVGAESHLSLVVKVYLGMVLKLGVSGKPCWALLTLIDLVQLPWGEGEPPLPPLPSSLHFLPFFLFDRNLPSSFFLLLFFLFLLLLINSNIFWDRLQPCLLSLSNS